MTGGKITMTPPQVSIFSVFDICPAISCYIVYVCRYFVMILLRTRPYIEMKKGETWFWQNSSCQNMPCRTILLYIALVNIQKKFIFINWIIFTIIETVHISSPCLYVISYVIPWFNTWLWNTYIVRGWHFPRLVGFTYER